MKLNLQNAFLSVVFLSLLLISKLTAAPVIYEAEKGTLTGTTVSTSTPGFTGTGYVSGLTAAGDKITVTVSATTAGIYNLTIRFSCPNGPKTEYLYVNNVFSSNLTFPVITGFSILNAGGIFLNSGSNTISIVKNWGYTDIDYFGIELAPPHSYANVTASLINPNADAKAKALYNLIKSKYGNCILSGQTGYWNETIALAGKTPAVRGFDMQNYSPHNPWYNWSAGEDGTVQSAIDWYNSTGGKGIVTFHWHWFSPSGGALSTSTFYTNKTTFDVSQGVISGTQENKDILRDIDAIAVQLKKLQAAGVPVLWRPLHEAGGAWFWWGAKGSAACKSLYNIMYNRLTNFHGINNLIWVWSTPEASWYPGNTKVDILGYDSYPGAYNYASQKSIFDQLFTIVGGQKIIAMTENGPIPDITQCFQQDAPWAYFMSWVDLVATQNTTAHIVDSYNQTCNLADLTAAAPVISGFSPACGSAGTSVTITGTSLGSATSIKFNGVVGIISSNTATQIVVKAPTGVTTGTISVSTSSGSDISSGTFTVAAVPTIDITITSGVNPGCASDPLTFTATRTNGGSTPAYQWKVNGINAGTNSATFTSSTLITNDVVSCVLTSNGVCVTTTTATSNNITLTRYIKKTPAITIALTTGTNPSCAGTSQTFTATATDGGTTPVYQWKVNGVNTGTNSPSFSSSTLANNSVISCVLTSNLTCVTSATDVSNSITLTRNPNVTPAITIALTTGTNPSCAGTFQTFTATATDGGTTPVYQWKVNSNNVGTNSTTFSSSTLKNSDVVSCMLTSNAVCANPVTATSNSIIVSVKAMPLPNAGTDKFITTSSTNLGANAPLTGETGVWSTTSAATITTTSSPTSMVGNLGNGPTIFRWTLDNGPCSAFNEVTINKGVAPVSTTIAGPDFFDPGVVYTYFVSLNSGSTYKWTIPAGATITQNNGNSIKVSFSSSANGNLSVTETNPYGSATSNKAVSIKITTGVENDEVKASHFLVFPNPLDNNNPLRIMSERTNKVKLKIIDMEGTVLYFSEEFYTNESTLAHENLPSGVLFLIINYNDSVLVKKIIK